MPFISTQGRAAAFAGKTLVLPAVSFGNVGQLAVDVLISTALLQEQPGGLGSTAKRVGEFVSRHVLPVVGADAFEGECERRDDMYWCTGS